METNKLFAGLFAVLFLVMTWLAAFQMGSNRGLREIDAKTIQLLRDNNKAYQAQFSKAIQLLQAVADQDSNGIVRATAQKMELPIK